MDQDGKCKGANAASPRAKVQKCDAPIRVEGGSPGWLVAGEVGACAVANKGRRMDLIASCALLLRHQHAQNHQQYAISHILGEHRLADGASVWIANQCDTQSNQTG